MQTHCPHCDTHFRVTESQIDTADGYVRCGVCEEVFNVYDVETEETLTNKQQPLLDDSIDNEENIEQEQHLSNEDIHQDEELPFDEVQLESEAFSTETIDENESQEKSDDFFNEEVNESLHHIIPEELRQNEQAGQSLLTKTIWGSALTLLITSLAGQYIWFNRDQFKHIPELQAGIDKLCQQFTCQDQSKRDPSKMKLVSRNVYSHPSEKEALMIDVIMRNTAEYAQPYPVMQIDFSDIRGNNVAARRFFPAEYLVEKNQQNLLQPETETNITLEIKDPGKHAMTYEFNFL